MSETYTPEVVYALPREEADKVYGHLVRSCRKFIEFSKEIIQTFKESEKDMLPIGTWVDDFILKTEDFKHIGIRSVDLPGKDKRSFIDRVYVADYREIPIEELFDSEEAIDDIDAKCHRIHQLFQTLNEDAFEVSYLENVDSDDDGLVLTTTLSHLSMMIRNAMSEFFNYFKTALYSHVRGVPRVSPQLWDIEIEHYRIDDMLEKTKSLNSHVNEITDKIKVAISSNNGLGVITTLTDALEYFQDPEYYTKDYVMTTREAFKDEESINAGKNLYNTATRIERNLLYHITVAELLFEDYDIRDHASRYVKSINTQMKECCDYFSFVDEMHRELNS